MFVSQTDVVSLEEWFGCARATGRAAVAQDQFVSCEDPVQRSQAIAGTKCHLVAPNGKARKPKQRYGRDGLKRHCAEHPNCFHIQMHAGDLHAKVHIDLLRISNSKA
jgi:hypothetical protein